MSEMNMKAKNLICALPFPTPATQAENFLKITVFSNYEIIYPPNIRFKGQLYA